MELRIKATVCSGIVILVLSGKLGILDFSLKQTVDTLLRKGCREFVLDISELQYIDCFGLGQLIRILISIQESCSGHLTLVRPTEHVLKLLQVTRLDSIFRIVDDDTVDLEAFTPQPASLNRFER